MIDFVIFVLSFVGGFLLVDAARRRSLKDGVIGLVLILGPTILRHLVGL